MSITKLETFKINDQNKITIYKSNLSTDVNIKFEWQNKSITKIITEITGGTKVGYEFRTGNICRDIIKNGLCFHVLELFAVRIKPQNDTYSFTIDKTNNPLCILNSGSVIFTKIIVLSADEYKNIDKYKCKSFLVNGTISSQPETKDGAIIVSI